MAEMRLLVLLVCLSNVFAVEKEPKVIIVGAGVSGIAAASKLLQNGITDVTILEAEGRIGGRLNSTRFGEYWIDIGAEWVHGEINNAVYDLAAPLGLLSKSLGPGVPDEQPAKRRYYSSDGKVIIQDIEEEFTDYASMAGYDPTGALDLKTGSIGENLENNLNEYYDDHPDTITQEMRQGLTHLIKIFLMALEPANDLNDVSLERALEYDLPGGYLLNNWKDQAYKTILDILMKKIPNSEEELPIVNNTLLNKKVTKIKYDAEPVKVTTADGSEYTADHVISTVSLGVMKADHEKIFEPALPQKHKNAIESLGFGHNAKIFLYYEEPWWDTNDHVVNLLAWTEADRKEIENDPERKWMLGVGFTIPIEFKPKLLFLWMSGPYCEQMEKLPDAVFNKQIIELIQKFFGKTHKLTQPKDIIRSRWNTNENVRGSYSYGSLAAVANNAQPDDLATPVMRDDKPVVQFAGEATDPQYKSVHGALKSGWREADRIIKLYEDPGMLR